jgi:hydrogenase expression/formation protein HypD
MKFVEEFRNRQHILSLSAELKKIIRRDITLMEVCGGHTMAIHRFGLHALLPPGVRLLSGPGCPVCVSGQHFIDTAVAFARLPGVITATYGDLLRVPGSSGSLEKEKSAGKDIRVIWSALEAVDIAAANPGNKIVFPGIGFETTAPATAAAIIDARKRRLDNFFILSAHKVMPPVMKELVNDGVRLDGFIAPGHVTAITGTSIYTELAEKFRLGVVVAGFEPVDLMLAILMLVRQVLEASPKVENQYHRVVKTEGNPIALKLMDEVFELRDDHWRGLGIIRNSGLKLKPAYASFDAEPAFNLSIPEPAEPKGCICGLVLRGLKTPSDCKLFANTCTPSDPVGACMVSGEGTCATYYKYRI